MIQCELSISDDASQDVQLKGDIYNLGDDHNAHPVVSDVFVSQTHQSRFPLGPGKYKYCFYFAAGSDKATLGLNADGKAVDTCDPTQFDGSKYASNLAMRFTL